MQGYNRDDAKKYMLSKLDKKAYSALPTSLESLLAQAMDNDFAYMRQSGVLGKDGMMGEEFYDDDEAFEFMLDAMLRQRGYGEEQEAQLAAFLDDYMDLQSEYLAQRELIAWDDEL